MTTLFDYIIEIQTIMKAPPGPPPRPGLEWKEETSRWIRPDAGEEHAPQQAHEYSVGDLVQWRTKGGKNMQGSVQGVAPRSNKIKVQFPSGKTWPIDVRLVLPAEDAGVQVKPPFKSKVDQPQSKPSPPGPEPASVVQSTLTLGGEMDFGLPEYIDMSRIDSEFRQAYPEDIKGEPSYVNPKEHMDGIGQYIGGVGGELAEELNQRLRDGGLLPFSLQDVVTKIKEVMRPIERPQRLFRGMFTGDPYSLMREGKHQAQFRKFLIEGNEVPIDAFMSTSRSPSHALEYTQTSMGAGIFMEIETTPETVAATISSADEYTGESETLLDMNQKLRIMSVRDVSVRNVEYGEDYTVTYVQARVS